MRAHAAPAAQEMACSEMQAGKLGLQLQRAQLPLVGAAEARHNPVTPLALVCRALPPGRGARAAALARLGSAPRLDAMQQQQPSASKKPRLSPPAAQMASAEAEDSPMRDASGNAGVPTTAALPSLDSAVASVSFLIELPAHSSLAWVPACLAVA